MQTVKGRLVQAGPIVLATIVAALALTGYLYQGGQIAELRHEAAAQQDVIVQQGYRVDSQSRQIHRVNQIQHDTVSILDQVIENERSLMKLMKAGGTP
jgi:hypothetical protein